MARLGVPPCDRVLHLCCVSPPRGHYRRHRGLRPRSTPLRTLWTDLWLAPTVAATSSKLPSIDSQLVSHPVPNPFHSRALGLPSAHTSPRPRRSAAPAVRLLPVHLVCRRTDPEP